MKVIKPENFALQFDLCFGLWRNYFRHGILREIN